MPYQGSCFGELGKITRLLVLTAVDLSQDTVLGSGNSAFVIFSSRRFTEVLSLSAVEIERARGVPAGPETLFAITSRPSLRGCRMLLLIESVISLSRASIMPAATLGLMPPLGMLVLSSRGSSKTPRLLFGVEPLCDAKLNCLMLLSMSKSPSLLSVIPMRQLEKSSQFRSGLKPISAASKP